jgi:hypothetical protein
MTKKENNSVKPGGAETPEEKGEFLPPSDFSSIILPLYTPALIKLGLFEDPLTGKINENLDLAKRLIDLLDLLRIKTEGNLDAEEQKFLDGCIQQLKMAYLSKAKNKKN